MTTNGRVVEECFCKCVTEAIPSDNKIMDHRIVESFDDGKETRSMMAFDPTVPIAYSKHRIKDT